ncbi:MAG: DNA polymerase III subunit alpha [Culicoidibacterales bacterium]
MFKEIIAFQSVYSLLQSTITIPMMIEYAAKMNCSRLLIADINNMSGVIEFYDRCEANKIKPYIGLQCHYQENIITCIAKSKEAYTSLNRVCSQLNATIKLADIEIFSLLEDVVCIVEQARIEVINSIKVNEKNEVFFSQTADCRNTNQSEAKIIPFMIINHLEQKDGYTLEMLHAIDRRVEVTNLVDYTPLNLVGSKKTVLPLLQDKYPKIFDFSQQHLPLYQGTVAQKQQLFKTLCNKGLEKRYGAKINKTHIERLAEETSVIVEMGFIDYFLIIWDVMKFARNEDIIIGPGRGSAVGSIVSFVLGITKIDPLEHQLLFERFLNKDRKTLPDIDIDVEDARRIEIIEYLKVKYSIAHVVQIGTFGTFGAKSAIRDCAKACGYPPDKTAQLVKQIIFSQKTIRQNIAENPVIEKMMTLHHEIAQIIKLAETIEGFPRHFSTHAAGVLLTNQPITNHLATIEIEQNVLVTQATMKYCEQIGLLKIDFLGLRNLSVIRNVAKKIEPNKAIVTFIEQDIQLQDSKTYKLLEMAETAGIFQLESKGMRQILKKFQIKSFDDITTVISLYRPGPMQFIDEYIERKNNNKPYTDIMPETHEVLKSTYGIMVYQEQIMKIVQVVGQMSLADADTFRRAIAKKNLTLLTAQKQKFLRGAERQNISPENAQKVFAEIIAFANYGFNKSHAVAYAQIAYQMAYLKANHPAVFLTELINSVINNEKKVYLYLQEALRLGLKILPPDIIKSAGKYKAEGQNQIRMGLNSIKGIGKITVEQILRERSVAMFTGIGDFLGRLEGNLVNKDIVLQLVFAYAFHRFSKNQRALLRYVEIHEQGARFQGEIIKLSNEIHRDIDDFSLEERMTQEQKAFGFSLFANPLLKYPPNKESLNETDKNYETFIVMVDSIKEITTKTKQKMAFIAISDLKETTECIMFPNAFEKYSIFVKPQKTLKIALKFQHGKNGEKTKSIEKVELL